jgi:puromycin-sensitive aminopeptidase
MFVDKFKRAESPQDQMRALYALADFQSADLIERACNFAFSGEVKTQNAPFLLNRCIANREFGTVAWRIVRQRWTEANEKFPVNTIVRMVDTTKTLNTPELLADVQAFFAEHAIPQAAKTLEQVLERQRVNTALRSREGQTLLDTLSR